jgi:hypothetical protein
MLSVPRAAEPLLSRFSIAFTRRTFQRAITLFMGMLLCLHQHTVTAALRAIAPLAPGHFSDYHRVFCRARWSLWPLGRVLSAAVIAQVPKDQPVICNVDEHSEEHRGKKVYGKGRHRDNCHATRTHNVYLFGHCWVVLCILVQFPFASRPWALPVLFALYRTREQNEREKRRVHKTPIVLARQLMVVLMHWFPERKFILCGDGHYAAHELARFCYLHRDRVTLVSLLHPRAHLCEKPKPRRKGQKGRGRIRGKKLPHPQDVVKQAKRKRSTVSWYGGKKRRVEFVSQTAHWYKATEGLVPIRWVFVHDLDGTHEDRYFYSTDPTMSASRIISLYTGRWSIEVTFQEARAHLGISTPRNRTKLSVLRTFPCLLGCFSVVSLLFHEKTKGQKVTPESWAWYHKPEVTFADAIGSVREMFWQSIFSEAYGHDALKKVPRQLRQTLLHRLSLAA